MAGQDSIPSLRRLTLRYDESNGHIDDYFQRSARGESTDGAEFFALVQKRTTAQMAMEATIKLHVKPAKTVLTESH